jgi:hypothetical protein
MVKLLVELVCAGVVVAGVAMVSVPAALVVAGLAGVVACEAHS